MLTRRVRLQLIAFAVVIAVAVSVLTVRYLRVPAELGVGRYEVTAALASGSGIYEGAPVTYRGVEIGDVDALRFRPGGVEAVLSLRSGVEVPSGSSLEVTNGSVVGEPYLNFVSTGASDRPLGDGAAIPAERTSHPVQSATLLKAGDELLDAMPPQALRTTIHELYEGTRGTDQDARRLLTSSFRLQEAATAHQGPTLGLIDRLQPVLANQADARQDIRSWAEDLDAVTGTVAASDDDLRAILSHGPPAATELSTLLDATGEPLTQLTTRILQTSAVAHVYQPAIEHILIMLPALVEANRAVAPRNTPEDSYNEAGLSFKLGVNSPRACVTGFPDSTKQRSPGETGPAPLPKDSYCKVPKDSPLVVRGARNMPCPQAPWRTGATAEQCGLVFDEREAEGEQ